MPWWSACLPREIAVLRARRADVSAVLRLCSASARWGGVLRPREHRQDHSVLSRPAPGTALRWVAVTVAVLAISALVLWALPLWLTRYPGVEGAERHTAVAATRLGIVGYLVALGTAVTVAYTTRTYRLTHTGQVTDRYTKAIGQLGDDARDVRIGAIYALERITKDSPDDQPMIIEVVSAFIREHTPYPSVIGTEEPPISGARGGVSGARRVAGQARSAPTTSRPGPSATAQNPPAADVQAALTVIARRARHPHERAIDLRRANLTGVNLFSAHLPAPTCSGPT